MNKRKNKKRSIVNFEMNNAIHWFPDEIEYNANENTKRFYRRQAAKRWAKAMIKAAEYNEAHREKVHNPKPNKDED